MSCEMLLITILFVGSSICAFLKGMMDESEWREWHNCGERAKAFNTWGKRLFPFYGIGVLFHRHVINFLSKDLSKKKENTNANRNPL